MPSNFIQFNQQPDVGRYEKNEDKIEELERYIKGLVEQLRYEFRHLTLSELEAGKIEGILSAEQGGTGVGSLTALSAQLATTLQAPAWRQAMGVQALTVDTASADNLTITGQSALSGTINIEKEGYTPIAVAGFSLDNATNSGVNAGWCHPYRLYLSSQTECSYSLRNHTASEAKVKLTVYILYGN